MEKAERAAADMSGDVEVGQLDLADLASVHAFADSVEIRADRHRHLERAARG